MAKLPSNGVRLMEFDTLLQISLVVETIFFKHMFNSIVCDYPVVLNIDSACAPMPR